MSDTHLRRILEALNHLGALIQARTTGPEPSFDRLLDGYIEARRSIAAQFRGLARETLISGEMTLDRVRREVSGHMRKLFWGKVGEQYVEVQGYGGVHPVLLEYLAQHVGEPVPSSRLRLLTGEQIHTERRVRELRDLGMAVDSKHSSGEEVYVLKTLEIDIDYAARCQLVENIKHDKSTSPAKRAQLLEKAGVSDFKKGRPFGKTKDNL
jgi:hypothetical protein